jgi:hypothetical protein
MGLPGDVLPEIVLLLAEVPCMAKASSMLRESSSQPELWAG